MVVLDKTDVKEHERCIRCGKPLKSAESRQRGYGAVCWRKTQKIQKAAEAETVLPENAKKLF